MQKQDPMRMKSSSELAGRDSLIECLLARVQECEDDKVAVEQANDRLKTEIAQLRETNVLLHSTIKRLQVNGEVRTDTTPQNSPRKGLEDEWHAYDTMEANPPATSDLILEYSNSSSSDIIIDQVQPAPSPSPSAPASVDELLAFLVWLFLHIAVFIDSHRKVYQRDQL
jgi:hypothetical protein